MICDAQLLEPQRGDIALILPDGRSVRNFVLSSFLSQAVEVGSVLAMHTMGDEMLKRYAAAAPNDVCWQRLLPNVERPISFLLRNCLSYAQMYWVDSFPMRKNRNRPVVGSWRTRAAVHLARTIGKAAARPRRIRMLDGLHSTAMRTTPEFAHYRRLFQQTQPRVLLCSHQRPTEIIAPVLAAKSLGIPTATFIFSWDNLSSKGRIAAPFDHFLVWSDHMLQEMLRYYPDVSSDRLHVVGTPQFDPYADPTLVWTREEFFRHVGADASRALICFSGGDARNAIEDPLHLAALMRQIRAGEIRDDPQVLLRCCPSDDAQRFGSVLCQYPEVIFSRPAWHPTQKGNWAATLPSREDIQFLVNLTRHADLNINFASTMTLDFAIHDKPVVNLAFDVSDPPLFGMSMWEYYNQWDHYRPVIDLGAARFARSEQELAEHVNAYLDNPALDRDGRRRFKELQVGVSIGQSTQRITDVIEQLALRDRNATATNPTPRTASASCGRQSQEGLPEPLLRIE